MDIHTGIYMYSCFKRKKVGATCPASTADQ